MLILKVYTKFVHDSYDNHTLATLKKADAFL